MFDKKTENEPTAEGEVNLEQESLTVGATEEATLANGEVDFREAALTPGSPILEQEALSPEQELDQLVADNRFQNGVEDAYANDPILGQAMLDFEMNTDIGKMLRDIDGMPDDQDTEAFARLETV